MPSTTCANCGKRSGKHDRRCVHCGHLLVRSGLAPENAAALTGVGIGCVVGLVIGALFGPPGLLFGSIIGGSVTGAVFGGIVRSRLQQGQPALPAVDSLEKYEQIILERLAEIDQAEGRLRSVRKRIEKEGPAPEWQPVLAALGTAEEYYPSHRARYLARLADLRLARWLNSVEPLTDGWEGLTYDGCEQRLFSLGTRYKEGEALVRELAGQPASASAEVQSRIARLREMLAACEEFRRALLARQAETVMEGIRPLDEALAGTLTTPELLRQIELLRARAELGEFAAGFTELEDEHSRLRSELDATATLRVQSG